MRSPEGGKVSVSVLVALLLALPVGAFVRWYNTRHLHSAIRFVTPEDRHEGSDIAILAARHVVYERARFKRPERWSGALRHWQPVPEVRLNPEKTKALAQYRAAA